MPRQSGRPGYAVWTLQAMLPDGDTPEAIANLLPGIEPEDVEAVAV